jgi:hypothetical protein
MSKRRATQDDDEVEELTPPKRARVRDEEAVPRQGGRGQQTRRGANGDDADADMDDAANAHGDDAKFEAENGEAIREAVQKKSKSQGVRALCSRV